MSKMRVVLWLAETRHQIEMGGQSNVSELARLDGVASVCGYTYRFSIVAEAPTSKSVHLVVGVS